MVDKGYTLIDTTHDTIDETHNKYIKFQNKFEDDGSNIKDKIVEESEIVIINVLFPYKLIKKNNEHKSLFF